MEACVVIFCQLIAHNLSVVYCNRNKTIHSFIHSCGVISDEGVVLSGVEVKSEQVSLESFAEDRERLCCPDVGWEFVPPLRLQNRTESRLH